MPIVNNTIGTKGVRIAILKNEFFMSNLFNDFKTLQISTFKKLKLEFILISVCK
jgi:hypothetical protein